MLSGLLGPAPGNGSVAKMYFTTGPTWDSTKYVPVDSITIPPDISFGASPVAMEQAFTPAFVKGCLGNPAPVRPSPLPLPNGGENWIVGSSHNITWTSQNFSNDVKIEYSTDAGSTWNTIAASTANDGTEPWIIPNTPTTQARVKVSDATIWNPF